MSDLSTRRIRIWNSLSFNRGRFPVCPGERLNGIQEVSGSIPLISTNDEKDREFSVLCPFLLFHRINSSRVFLRSLF